MNYQKKPGQFLNLATRTLKLMKNFFPLTVEPLNKGHFGSSLFVLYTEVVLCSEAKQH